LSRTWRARLDDQIAALERLRDGLDSCIGCGCLSLRKCAMQNPGDLAAGRGRGAVYLPAPLRPPA
jgi:MerR family redox-sensitive transcriptional activator SoxR